MFCAQCGHRLAETMKFCPQCGTRAVLPASLAPAAQLGVDFPAGEATGLHRLVARIKALLLTPSAEWPVIAAERTSAGAIYGRYVAPLAAVGVVAGFIGHMVIGYETPLLGHSRTGIDSALGVAVAAYLLSFIGVLALAWLVDALAPVFGGKRDRLRALKLTAYSCTPAWLAGALQIVPALGMLALLAGCYGLYLLYVGLPVLMRCPKEKSARYTFALVLCAVFVSVLIASATSGVMTALGPVETDIAHGPGTQADRARVGATSTQLGKIGETRPVPERQADTDMIAALNAIGATASSGKDVQPVDFRKLKEMLPETLGGMRRVDATGQSGEAMGIKGSSATARYTDQAAGASLNVDISDMGSLAGLAGLASRLDPAMEKQTDAGYERTRKVNGQIVHERYDRRTKSGEISIILAERFNVAVRGNGVDAAALQGAIREIDLGAIVALAK